jgi:hypothetical protein
MKIPKNHTIGRMPFVGSVEYTFAFNSPSQPIGTGLVTNDLVIQLDAYLVASYPGTGTSVFDLTSGFTHTMTDSATYQTLYGVKTFNCTSNKVLQCSVTGPTLPASGYTYVCWGRVIISSTGWRTLYRTAPNDHPLLIQVGTDNLGFYDNNTNAFIDSGYDVTPIEDLWVQYTVVGDNGSSIFYINGTQVGSTAYGAAGNRHDYWGAIESQPFGYVANMYYYSRKLSSAEVTQMYNYLSPRFPNIVTSGSLVNVQAGNYSSYVGSGATWTNLVDITNYTITSGTYDSANGGSIVFNGTSTVVPIGSPLSSGTNYTIEAWVLASDTSGGHNIVSSVNNVFYVTGGILYGGCGGNFTLVSSSGFPLNVWKHVVLTFDDAANTMTLYVNGSQVNQNTNVTQSFIGGETLRIGSHASGETPVSFWNGKIAQVRVYNTALTAANVLNNFNATKGGYLVTTSSLVLYYDPSDNASYPGTGTTLTNLQGTGLNGTMTALAYTNPYLTYNGTTSQVSIADNAALEPGSGDWTIEAWIRYNVIAGKTRTYVSKTNGGGGSADWGYGLRTNSATSTTYMEVGNGTTSLSSPSTSVTTGVWYQIVGVWTNVASNSIALYKNGALVGSSSHSFTSIRNTTNPLYLGNYNGNEFAQQFDGDMGIVRIYSKALSAAEVLNNYDANKALYGLV